MALKPMNCPGHMLLFGSQLRVVPRPADPLRGVLDAPSGRARGHAPRAPPRQAHHAGRRARLRAPRTRSRTRSTRMIDFVRFLYDRFGVDAATPSSRRARRTGSAPTSSGTAPRERSQAALDRHGMEYVVSPGEGAFYGPKIDLHMTDVLGRSWQMGTIQLDYQMPVRFGLTYMGAGQPRAQPGRHPPRAPRLARALHRHPGRALRRRLPVLARARAGARRPGRRVASRRGPGAARAARERTASASRSTSATRRSASGSAKPRSRRSRSSSSTATASRTTRWPCGSVGEGSRRSRSTSCSSGSASSRAALVVRRVGC